jgi:hypothetical protein
LNIKGTGNGLGNGPVAGTRADNRGGSVYFNNKAIAKACEFSVEHAVRTKGCVLEFYSPALKNYVGSSIIPA